MTLILVYNARSGRLNRIIDSAHKLLSPNSYACHLCNLTHDTFSENNTWKEFRHSTHIEMEFYHIDEFEKTFGRSAADYPVIFRKENEILLEFMPEAEIQTLKSTEDLIRRIKNKLG